MIKPTTPEELIGDLEKPYIPEAHDNVVNFINGILALEESKAALLIGRRVLVFDSSKSAAWELYCERAVQMFQEVGWGVEKSDGSLTFEFYLTKLPEEAEDA